MLHAGGKFGGGGYKVSGGLHGVGASVVNALSEWLEVEICHEGKVYQQRYERGKVLLSSESCGRVRAGEDRNHGYLSSRTRHDFPGDDRIYEFDILKQRLREMAFLTKGHPHHTAGTSREEEPSREGIPL